MSAFKRLPVGEFQIKAKKRPFKATASEIRDKAVLLGFKGVKALTRANVEKWLGFIKAKIHALKAERAGAKQQDILLFDENSRVEDNKGAFTQISYDITVLTVVSGVIQLDKLAKSIITQLNGFVARVIKDNNLQPEDRMSFAMISDDGKALSTGFVKRDDLSGDLLTNEINKLLSNYSGFQLDDKTKIYIKISRRNGIANPVVGGKKTSCASKEAIYDRRSVIQVDGGGLECCFQQCVALGLAFMSQKANKDGVKLDFDVQSWEKMTKSKTKQKYREESAKAISKYCGIKLGVASIPDDALMVEEKLGVEIVIFDVGTGLTRVFPPDKRISAKKREPKQIYMLKTGDHVDYVKKPHCLFMLDKWCPICFTGYKQTHLKCAQTCDKCHSNECVREQERQEAPCKACNQVFYSEACFDRHLKRKLCAKRTLCRTCFQMYDRSKDKHVCGERKCPNCKETVDLADHKCYIQRLKTPENVKDNKYIYYDCEAYVNENPHRPYLFVAMYSFSNEVFEFSSKEEFCQWVLDDKHKGYTAIAHNGGGYDVHAVRNYCLENGVLPVKGSEIYKGGKLISVKFNGVRFIDSARFINGPLSGFADTFGMDKSKFSKGHFPYRFVTPENIHNTLEGLPEKHWFDFNLLKSKKSRDEANFWYDENEDKPYNPWEATRLYCRQDVMILKQGCEILRNMFIETSKIDPFQSVTIASVCQKIYLQNDMPTGSIAVLNDKSAQLKFVAQEEYLNYISNTLGRELVRQYKVGSFICGAYDSEAKTVYEFNGCYFHGCPSCYPGSFFNKKLQARMASILAKTQDKESKLKKEGFKVVSMWGCEWAEMKKDIPRNIWEYQDDTIDYREAIQGGRTEVFQSYAESTDDMLIRYSDYVSLYPSVMSGKFVPITKEKEESAARYPVGHPVEMKRPDQNEVEKGLLLDKYYGFVKCTILPPRDLKIPLLGKTLDGKLKFGLCAACAASNTKSCTHSEQERALVGTWTTAEVKKALVLGYRFLEVYCLSHFPDTYKVWDEATDTYEFSELSTSLFSSYVSRFFAIKDKAARENNAGLKAISKLCLNNLWGKFAQRELMTSRETCSGKRCHQLVHYSPDVIVKDVTYLSPDVYSVEFQDKNKALDTRYKISAVIGAYTTSLARLRLYEALEVLGDSVIYCDTDSVVYYEKKGVESKVLTSKILGALEDELKGGYIREFVALAPKTYGYIADIKGEKKVEVKCKGFVLNLKNQKQVNIGSYKAMVRGRRETIKTVDMQFKIRKHSGLIETTELQKEMIYKPDKRILQGVNSVPFGYYE